MILFKLILEYLVRKMQVSELGGTLNGTTQILGYADDLHLVGDYRGIMAKNAEILIKVAKDTGGTSELDNFVLKRLTNLDIWAETLMTEMGLKPK